MRPLYFLLFNLFACAEPIPDYILTSGLSVFDPHNLSSKEEIDVWVSLVVKNAPETDKAKILPFLQYATLTIDPKETIDGQCDGEGDEEENHEIGCAFVGGDILVAWRTCDIGYPTSGILAHEIGHIIGHWDHSNSRFGENYYEGNRKGSMEFKIWAETCSKK